MFDYNKIIKDFGLDMQTSKDMLDAIQEWSKIFNGCEPWLGKDDVSLHVAKTICEKVSEAATIEFKSKCSDPYIDGIYQKFLRNIRKNTEYMTGKACIFFKPYFDGSKIARSTIQADKFIPVKFNNDGDLLGCIIIDEIVDGSTVYTRLEYNELLDNNKLRIRNIAYKGRKKGVILETKISLQAVEKWKELDEISEIEGVDRLIGGFGTIGSSNVIDNNSPIGMPSYYNAIDTLKEIDKQWNRTLWEYEGSELAIDIDESTIPYDKKGNPIYPTGKKRLFRTLVFDETKEKNYNIFSPEIRDSSMFNGLNEMLRQAEIECHLEHGTLSKLDGVVAKTATEIKQMKQSYYINVSDIQRSLEHAFEDLIYGIYVLCKLYGIPVRNNYTVEYDWDDSILVDKDSARNQALIERNNNITSDVQYIMDTRNMKEEEAIEYIQKQQEYRKLTQTEESEPVEE